jgi:peroxiredoxin Q/BCP
MLRNLGVQVVGVSKDSVQNQADFREKYSLPFPLVADEDGLMGEAFGVRTLVGIAYRRQSFLVVDGKVAWRDLSATPKSQSEDAIEALRAL